MIMSLQLIETNSLSCDAFPSLFKITDKQELPKVNWSSPAPFKVQRGAGDYQDVMWSFHLTILFPYIFADEEEHNETSVE